MNAMPQDRLNITVTVNGSAYPRATEARVTLSDFLRQDLGLTGTHVGCEHGVCGACTVVVDGSLVRSCLMFAVQADGSEVRTVEGMAVDGELHPIQAAFRESHGLQCGFCTPALLLTAEALLRENPRPTEREIREFIAGNVCRCTGYVGIVAAIRAAARKLDPGKAATQ